MRDVWIAIPAYTGQVHLATMRSIMTDTLALSDRGDKVTIFDESGNAMIADCRGLIVAKFLDSSGTDLIFIDADVTWEAGSLLRLVDHPVDFVAGLYPQRRDPINYCVSWLPDPHLRGLWADPGTGLLEVAGVPAGCMRLTRAMLEKMTAAYEELNFYCEEAPNKTVCGLFESYWIRGVKVGDGIHNLKLGEDYAFCRRWKDIGGQVWIDPELRLGHIGFKTFIGSIGEWLKSRAAA